MAKAEKHTRGKRTRRIVLLSVLGALLITGVCLILFLPVTYTVDRELIVKNPDYSVYRIEKGGYSALVKRDANGKALDGEFRLVGFTDVHLDTKREKGDVTMEYLIRNVVREKPDMVVFVGDNITSAINRRRAVQLAETMEALGVYWDLVLGNHEGDNIWSMSRQRMVRLFSKYPHCLMDASEKKTAAGETVWGCGNHAVLLLGSDETVVRSLIFLDGGADMSEEDLIRYDAEFEDKSHNDYDYVKESQIAWYLETVENIDTLSGAPVSSTIFDHIPLPEYRLAYETITGETEVTQNVPEYGSPDETGDCILAGQRREVICCSGHNSGLFDAMLASGSTDSFVCGHDHINDFILRYQGVLLMYNEPSGYSSYNLVSKGLADDPMQGYTLYTVSADGAFSAEQKHNSELWPEGREKVNALYR